MNNYLNEGLRALKKLIYPSVFGIEAPGPFIVMSVQSDYLEDRVVIRFSNGLKITTKISDLELEEAA